MPLQTARLPGAGGGENLGSINGYLWTTDDATSFVSRRLVLGSCRRCPQSRNAAKTGVRLSLRNLSSSLMLMCISPLDNATGALPYLSDRQRVSGVQLDRACWERSGQATRDVPFWNQIPKISHHRPQEFMHLRTERQQNNILLLLGPSCQGLAAAHVTTTTTTTTQRRPRLGCCRVRRGHSYWQGKDRLE